MLVKTMRQFHRGGIDACPGFLRRGDDLLGRKDHSSYACIPHLQRVRISDSGHSFCPILARACTSFGRFNKHAISLKVILVLHHLALSVISQRNGKRRRACLVYF